MILDDPAVAFRKGPVLPRGASRTLIVVGAARGGTTMIARMLHDLGIFMGEGLGSTYQDEAMSAISRALFDGEIDISAPAIGDVLRRRDRLFPVWGWKFTNHLFEALYAKTRNPHLVAVFRDPLAIATRESVSQGYAVAPCLERALQQIAAFGQFVLSTPYPCLAVSYERGLQRKSELVDALLDFAGIDAPSELRERAAQWAQPGSPEYLQETRAPEVEGMIDEVGSEAKGWLRYPHRPDRRVAFALLIDGEPIYNGVAERFRADLREVFGNDGCCSFAVPLPDFLKDGRQHRVRIEVADAATCAIGNNDRAWTVAAKQR